MRVLLVDDEKPARERLARLLRAYSDVEIVGEAANGKIALGEINRLKPDVVFLDIEMPELNGLETAAAIGLAGPSIVFITAYDEYALKAFETHAIDYLVKPIAKDRLETAIQKLRQRHSATSHQSLDNLLREIGKNRRKRIAVKSGQRYIVLNLDEISAITARDHYAEIVHGKLRTLADDSLDTVEGKLDPERFVRIHRSSLINLDYLKEMKRHGDRKYTAILSDHFESELPISRENIDKIKDHLSI